MNLTPRSSFLRVSGLAVLVGAASALTSAHAVDYYWVGDAALGLPANAGSGSWNLTVPNFNTNPAGGVLTATPWVDGNEAVFLGAPGGSVTIDDLVTATTVNFTGAAGGFNTTNVGTLRVEGNGLPGVGITNASVAAKTFQNGGIIEIAGTAGITPGTGINVVNGGSFNINETSSPVVALTSLTNSGTFIYFEDDDNNPVTPDVPVAVTSAGLVDVGRNNLTLSNFTLSAVAGESLSFTIGNTVPNLSTARITVSGGAFSNPNGLKTIIDFGNGGPVTAGTYDLINFAGATSVIGFNNTLIPSNALLDYQLGLLPDNVAFATLQYDPTGKILQLVAVPEPATLMMPMAAVLGMAWLRRRTARMAR